MRHKQRGRRLGRSSSHRKAMLRNLASSLFLTERETLEIEDNKPKVKGRVVTTLPKAKEVRSLVEKCVTLARKSLDHQQTAEQFATQAKHNSEEWRQWRQSEEWRKWNNAIAPVLAARRRAIKLLGDKQAVTILFDEIAPRFADRDGGYTRILRLAKPRLGDAGARAILEFVGVRDREAEESQKPAFGDLDEETTEEETTEEETADEEAAEDQSSQAEEQDSKEQPTQPGEEAEDDAPPQAQSRVGAKQDAEPESQAEDQPKKDE